MEACQQPDVHQVSVPTRLQECVIGSLNMDVAEGTRSRLIPTIYGAFASREEGAAFHVLTVALWVAELPQAESKTVRESQEWIYLELIETQFTGRNIGAGPANRIAYMA